MPVPAQATLFNESVANGLTTSFPYQFMIASADDLTVELDGVVTTTGFTVSGVGDEGGGAVVFSVAPANGVTVLRYLDPVFDRAEDYQTLGDFAAAVVNLDFDRLWLAIQSIQARIGRAIKLPVATSDDQAINATASERANMVIGFDDDGNAALKEAADNNQLRVDLASSSGSSLVHFIQPITTATGNTVGNKLSESVSVSDFMTDVDRTANYLAPGSVDVAYAFNAMWQAIKATLDSDTANLPNVNLSVIVPPGTYYINSSVNWTGLIAWNIHVDMRGAKIIAGSGCSGKAIIDASNTRGLHIDGGYIESTVTAGSAPLCGLLLANSGTNTCGNNSFRDLKIMGIYTLAPYINIGSETTYHYNCYFAQTNTDTTTYAFIADGMHSRSAIVSDYTTLRATNTAVSFTNNKFYGCHFRNYGGGSCAYIRIANDWEFDAGCYWMAFNNSNVEVYQSTTQRCINLHLHGLFESSLSTGVDYAVTFIVPNGETSGLIGFVFNTNTPHASNAIFRMVNESGEVTTGTLNLAQAEIKISGRTGSCMLFAQCANMTITGQISYRQSSGLNLYDIAKFLGVVYTTDGSLISGTPGSNIFNFMLFDETTYAGQVMAVSRGPTSYLGIQQGVRPLLRAEGSATDIDLALQGKGAGNIRFGTLTANADAPITGYITIKDAGGTARKLAVIS